MPEMIVMTALQAAAIAGGSSPRHELEPRPMQDGRFALPVRVCADPAHAAKHATLAGYPVEEVADADFSET
ncbi:MAG: hypothetical protein Kilf2KO_49150 [Rhodospirillales bacterium]